MEAILAHGPGVDVEQAVGSREGWLGCLCLMKILILQ
jgi:hypothetical protein